MRRLMLELKRCVKYTVYLSCAPFFSPLSVLYVREIVRLLRPFTSNHPLVRFGENQDGGYLVPDDLEGIEAVFSPGVHDKASFEAEFTDRGVRCFLIDASVDEAPESSPLIDFEPLFLGAHDRDPFTTLETWVNRKVGPDASELLLQMDIEGGEWDVLKNIDPSLLNRFRIIALELHPLYQWWKPLSVRRIARSVRRLTNGHTVVHIHANNCGTIERIGGVEVPEFIEVTLLRNDRIRTAEPTRSFPHPLDRTNVPHMTELPLPKCWYDYD